MSVKGLDDIMAELFAENRRPTYETADEIINELEERNNFIPESISARREYAVVLLREYRNYVKDRSDRNR